MDLMLALVEAASLYKIIPIGGHATSKTSSLNKLTKSSPGPDGGLLAFAVSLPKPDIVCQLVRMVIKALLAFLGAPDPDTISYEPFHNKWGLISNAAYAVEHENQKDVELTLLCVFFDNLQFISVLSPYLVPRNAIFLFFVDDGPAVSFGETVAFLALHRNVCLILIIVVHLLIGGHSI